MFQLKMNKISYIFILVFVFQSPHLILPAKSRPWTRKRRALAAPALMAGPHSTVLDLCHREADQILANPSLRLTHAGQLLEGVPGGLTTEGWHLWVSQSWA